MKMSLSGVGAAAILVTLCGTLAPPNWVHAQAPAPDGIGNGSWQPLRPTQERHGADAGRINVIAFDPAAATTVYIGAPTGGLWRSLDNGATWKSLTDALPNLAVTD